MTSFPNLLGAPAPSPIVGMAASADSGGYWVVQNDGAVSRFGDAVFFGSTLTTGVVPTAPIVGITGSVPAELGSGGVTPTTPLAVVGLAASR